MLRWKISDATPARFLGLQQGASGKSTEVPKPELLRADGSAHLGHDSSRPVLAQCQKLD